MSVISKGEYADVVQVNKHQVKKVFHEDPDDGEDRYSNELDMLLSWQKHSKRHVVKLLGWNDDQQWLLLEYVPHTLESLIMQHRLDASAKQHICKQLEEFLDDAEDMGIMHNDFKAKNIQVCADLRTVKVIDFADATWVKETSLSDRRRLEIIKLQLQEDWSYQQAYPVYYACASASGS